MVILGIETSCDETAASVVENGTKVLSHVLASSADVHAKTGGIIPETAAREQVKSIIPVIETAISDSGLTIKDIDAIAVTIGGPGLIGSLLVGVETAKTLACIWNKPIVPVVHMLAHVYANWLEAEVRPEFPAVVLTVSGGHSDLLIIRGHGDFKWIGGTRDDTSGEAFDKVARLLGLPFPGGPEIQKAAEHGNPQKIAFPRPLLDTEDYDFSFSGLKTAVLREVRGKSTRKEDVAASFQEAICDVLTTKAVRAVREYQARSLLLAGGVAANLRLRTMLQKKSPVATFLPPVKFCTDNGTFVGSFAYFNYQPFPWQKITAVPDVDEAVERYAKDKVK